MVVGFSEKAHKSLMASGATEFEIMSIVNKVNSMPKKERAVDAFDGISCRGVKLSFLRHHELNRAVVMLLSEAEMLDKIVDTQIANGEISIMAN